MRALLCRIGLHSLIHTCGAKSCIHTCRHCPYTEEG